MKTTQHGMVLIIVLWFIVLSSILIFTLASETRLSADIVMRNKAAVSERADMLKALRMAEMELLLARMPLPPDQQRAEEDEFGERKNPLYQFDGRPLRLSYPGQPENIIIRIYDHAGRLNLRRLAPHQMETLLKQHLPEDDNETLSELMDAWQDWIDPDDLARINGAEAEYYEELDPPYTPRNGLLETVEELLLIKGFADIFGQQDLNTAFTIYGEGNGINPNVASREVLSQIPELTGESIEAILTRRREEEFKNNQDFNEFMDIEELNAFLPWVSFTSSQFYTIALQATTPPAEPVSAEESESEAESDALPMPLTTHTGSIDSDLPQRAFMVTVQVLGTGRSPKVMRVDPYGVLPDVSHEAALPVAEPES
jgi:general secretion pathway protein K